MRSSADARRIATALLSLLVAAATPQPAAAQATARDLFARAQTLQQGLPPEGRDEDHESVARFRRVITAFELVVRQFPQSGYCDDALWQAARVADDAARRFGQARDRRRADGLLRWLAREYPTSPLARQAAARLGAAGQASPGDVPAGGRATTVPPVDTARSSTPTVPALAVSSRPPLRTPSAVTVPALGTLRSVRRTVMADVVRITIEADRELSHRTQRIERPSQVVIDFADAQPAPGFFLGTLSYPDTQVSRIRTSQPTPGVVRLSVTLGPTARHSLFTLYDPYRLVVDVERASLTEPSAASSTAPARPPIMGRPLPAQLALTPRVAGDGPFPPAPASEPVAATPGRLTAPPGVVLPSADAARSPLPSIPAPAAAQKDAASTPGSPPGTPSPNTGGGYSLARQLGLGVSRVVIDPGHGGHDPGAMAFGLNESALVLDIALRLEKLLAADGIQVVMTRRADEFVSLEGRTAIANREKADLFLSIHVNASRKPDAGGIETYFLNFATSPDAEAVAARENATSARTMASLTEIVRVITLNTKLNESRALALHVQRSMIRRLRAGGSAPRDLGVKQAPFVVLIGASMPSVLAEISFITHRQEARSLKGASFRQLVAAALADGLRRYQASLKTAQAGSSQ